MYAVIEIGGKQFRVGAGDEILVDQPETQKVETRVLMVVDGKNITTDRAKLDKVTVATSSHGEVRERLGRVMKFKPKQARSSKRIIGHRRVRTRVKIDKLTV